MLEPCEITVPSQQNQIEYEYTAANPPLSFATNPFIAEPNSCVITYSCEMLDGSLPDMCTEGTFDPNNGSYSFSTIDKVKFPPGTYTMKITGSVCSVSKSYDIDIILVDPCPDAALTLLPNQIQDDNYRLQDPLQS